MYIYRERERESCNYSNIITLQYNPPKAPTVDPGCELQVVEPWQGKSYPESPKIPREAKVPEPMAGFTGLRVLGFRVQGLGFKVKGLGFIQGSGFRVWGTLLGMEVQS